MIELELSQAIMLALAGLLLGIFMLVKGGDWTVESAVYLAEKVGMSHLLIGFTVVAFGTSLPELIVSVNANIKQSPGIALGNVIGSNIANILLVCGASAIIAPIAVTTAGLRRQVIVMTGATALLVAFLLYGFINTLAGAIMISLIGAYVFYEYNKAKQAPPPVGVSEEAAFASVLAASFFLVLGLGVVALGAEFMVNSTQLLAQWAGIPEAVIALTVIAFGTSLPELSTCLMAMSKRHGDLVLGNLIGSNVFNILLIIGATALVKPINAAAASSQIINFDIWVMAAVAVGFSGMVLFGSKIDRKTGLVFCTLYVLYVAGIYGYYIL